MKISSAKYDKLLQISIPILLAIFTYSQLKGFNMIFARTWIWLVLAFAIVALTISPLFKGKAFDFSIFYTLVVILNFVSGDGYFNSIPGFLTEIIVILLCIVLSRYIFFKKNVILIRSVVLVNTVVTIITCVLTIRIAEMMPGIVREVVVILSSQGGESAILDIYRLGVCEYPFPHALPILIPPLIFCALELKWKFLRIVAILLVGLIFYFLYICDVGTPLFVAVFVAFASLLMSPSSFKKSLKRIVIISLIATPFLSKGIMISSLETAENMITDETLIKKKVVDMKTSLQYGEAEGAADDRKTLYDKSLNGFAENVIWGTNDSNLIGGHSALLDRLSTLGLLGTIPFLLLLFHHLKFIFDSLPDRTKAYYLLSSIAFILMIAIKNMNNIYVWLFVSIIAPCFLLFASDLKTEKSKKRILDN